MRRGPRKTQFLGVFAAAALGAAQAAEPLPTDPASGLVMDDNWQIVAAHCGA